MQCLDKTPTDKMPNEQTLNVTECLVDKTPNMTIYLNIC